MMEEQSPLIGLALPSLLTGFEKKPVFASGSEKMDTIKVEVFDYVHD